MAVRLMNWLFYLLSFFNIWHDVRGQKRILELQHGDTFSIDCSDTLQGRTELYLYRRLSEKTLVLFWNATNDELTVTTTFRHRANLERNYENLSFNLHHMMENDSGVYWCTSGLDGKRSNRSAALVVVSGDAPCGTTGLTDGENADEEEL
ncbi:uncharacterized protein LOC108937305 isoform X2 [Scleropages formosus]|uniref:uncharacterized protein LOC108937305 isoform X2 n=1 Tax=Scleropages formosus TaxID=113540 RepID=UPI0008790AB3|nr:uncharacterized protein LOC108937305 isoform X2 [Scleropages formosus]